MIKKHTDQEYESLLNLLKDKVLQIKKLAFQLVQDSISVYINNDIQTAQKLELIDQEIDNLELEIDGLCEKILARRQPVASDLRFIIATLKQVTDIERIGDLGQNIVRKLIETNDKCGIDLPESFTLMQQTLTKMLELETDLYDSPAQEKYEAILKLDRKIDVYYVEIFRELITQITASPETTYYAMNLQTVTRTMERIGDHLTNLAELDIYLHEGKSLKHSALHEKMTLKNLKGILFLCVQNSARSQMAEGLAKSLLPVEVKVWSAGSDPADRINPYAIKAMKEIGVDISGQRPKKISSVPLDEINVVINLCGEEMCVDFPNIKKSEAWMIADPGKLSGSDEEIQKQVNLIRDEIKYRIENLKRDLLKFSRC